MIFREKHFPRKPQLWIDTFVSHKTWVVFFFFFFVKSPFFCFLEMQLSFYYVNSYFPSLNQKLGDSFATPLFNFYSAAYYWASKS